MSRIMSTLREDHRNILRLLEILDSQLLGMGKGDAPDLNLIMEVVQHCLTYPDLYHHPREDLIYRRLIRRGVSADQIGDMEVAHENLRGLTRRLAKVIEAEMAGGTPHTGSLPHLIERFTTVYREHIDAEESIFFPLAEKMFEESDWDAIDALERRIPLPSDTPDSNRTENFWQTMRDSWHSNRIFTG